MEFPEDIKKDSTNQTKQIEKDIDKLTPLGLKEPSGEKGDIQSSVQKPIVNLLKEICPSIRDYVSNYIALADAKAGVLIGVFSALLSVGISKGDKIFTSPVNQWSVLDYCVLLDWSAFILGITFALLVVWPKTPTCKKKGFISWVHIAAYKEVDSYLKDILSSGEAEISGQLCELNYDLSHVCKRKYFWLAWSFKLGFSGSVLLGILLVLRHF